MSQSNPTSEPEILLLSMLKRLSSMSGHGGDHHGETMDLQGEQKEDSSETEESSGFGSPVFVPRWERHMLPHPVVVLNTEKDQYESELSSATEVLVMAPESPSLDFAAPEEESFGDHSGSSVDTLRWEKATLRSHGVLSNLTSQKRSGEGFINGVAEEGCEKLQQSQTEASTFENPAEWGTCFSTELYNNHVFQGRATEVSSVIPVESNVPSACSINIVHGLSKQIIEHEEDAGAPCEMLAVDRPPLSSSDCSDEEEAGELWSNREPEHSFAEEDSGAQGQNKAECHSTFRGEEEQTERKSINKIKTQSKGQIKTFTEKVKQTQSDSNHGTHGKVNEEDGEEKSERADQVDCAKDTPNENEEETVFCQSPIRNQVLQVNAIQPVDLGCSERNMEINHNPVSLVEETEESMLVIKLGEQPPCSSLSHIEQSQNGAQWAETGLDMHPSMREVESVVQSPLNIKPDSRNGESNYNMADSGDHLLPQVLVVDGQTGSSNLDQFKWKSAEIYDSLESYMLEDEEELEQEDIDLSCIMSDQVLDNSAMMSRVRLSRRLSRRPPGESKRRQRGKGGEEQQNWMFCDSTKNAEEHKAAGSVHEMDIEGEGAPVYRIPHFGILKSPATHLTIPPSSPSSPSSPPPLSSAKTIELHDSPKSENTNKKLKDRRNRKGSLHGWIASLKKKKSRKGSQKE